MWIWIVLVVVVIYLVTQRSGYSTPVTLLTAEETNQFLKSDPDGFVKSLNKWDLFARKVSSPQEYLDQISRSGVTCDISYDMLNKVDDFFRAKGEPEIANIPWVIAMTKGTMYEDGYPHTRQNVIFLSGPTDFKTLVHEKLHVSQRYNPPDLKAMGYKYLRPRQGEFRLRSNPDLSDGLIWQDAHGREMVAHYNSDRPMGLWDVDIESRMEHPYEYLAYTTH